MADPNSPTEAIEWLNRVFGFIAGVGATIVSLGTWVSNKIKQLNTRIGVMQQDNEKRMTAMEQDYVRQDSAAIVQIATLKAYHEANIQRLSTIEAVTTEISRKQDQLMMMAKERRQS